MDWCLFDCALEYFPSFSLISYVKRITIVSWGGGQKMWCFSVFSRQTPPHPTCTRCRGRVCTRDLTCDICAEWSSVQWELFAKKRSYAERKHHSCPSGTVPRARTSSEVKHCEASSSSSSLPSGGQAKRGGGGLGMHLVLRPVRLPLLPLDLGPARGVEVSLVARPVRASALLSPRLLRELGRGELIVRSGRPLPVHALRRGESGESSGVCSLSRSSRVSRSSDRGTRKDRRSRSRSGSSRDRSRRSRARSTSRSRWDRPCE